MATNLGKVMITTGKEYVTGLAYREKTIVTYKGNTYISLKDTAETPSNDGVNWWLLLEGVPIATVETPGKVKPDGETITADADGTLHGASQVPEGVTFVDLEAEDETLPTKLPINADQLGGQNPEYYATEESVSKIISGETAVGKATDADTVDGYHVSDLPYLPLTSGTLTGRLTISPPTGNTEIFLQNNVTGNVGTLHNNTDKQINIFNMENGTIANFTALVLSGKDEELSKLLRLTRTVDGTMSIYKVFGEHNSRPVAIGSSAPSLVGAAWIDTASNILKYYKDGAWTPVS